MTLAQYDTKKWYQSKSVWGGIIALAGVAAGLLGYSIDEATQQELVEALSKAATVIGSIIAVIGRVVAQKKIEG